MRTYKHELIFFSFLLFLTGCSSTNFARISMNRHLQKSEGMEIPILSGDSDSIYERIGVIFVYGEKSLTKELINDKLRQQAREVGADAIIFAKYGEIDSSEYFKSYGSAYTDFDWAKKHGTGSWLMKGKPTGAGLAISYKPSKKLH